MLINNNIKNELKNKFPANIELSFGKSLQSKVQSDLYVIIPRGKKCVLWFTYIDKENVCFQVDIDSTRKPVNFNVKHVCFRDELSWGTILVGTLVKYKNIKTNILHEFFTIEQIKYYKGEDTCNFQYEKQLNLINKLLENDIKFIKDLPNFLNITIPIIKTNYETAYKTSLQLYYNTYGISFWNLKDRKSLGDLANNLVLEKEKENEKEDIKNKKVDNYSNNITSCIFNVKCNLDFDSYSLYGLNYNGEYEYFSNANIPDYKTSVIMNNIFRKIKENKNLDLLEESDDEDEFENTREDKFVDLEKVVSMKCVFLPKFKAWKPVSIAQNEKISRIPIIKEVNTQRLYNNNSNNKVKPYSSYKSKFNSCKKINEKIKQKFLISNNKIE